LSAARSLGASGAIAAASLLVLALIGMPVAGAGPLPSLATLPLPTLPPLPLPTLPPLPLPTLPPVPTLPLPTVPLPTVPLPTVPLPTVPLPSGLPGPTGSTPGGSPAPSASAGPFNSIAPGPATPASSNAGGAIAAVEGPSVDQEPSPFQFVLPLLIAGIPIAVILLIVGLQVAGGAAWLPVIRRWLNRTPTAGP
jgi:hypothetical protein